VQGRVHSESETNSNSRSYDVIGRFFYFKTGLHFP
jgi:hypothetical protein